MKIHALITTLVLGSSSVAMARPVTVTAHAEWTLGNKPAPVTVVRDHRLPTYEADLHPMPTVQAFRYGRWNRGYEQPQPVVLGSNLHFSGNRTFINVLGEGRFTTLRLDGFNGQSLIYQVAIEFEGGGATQVVRNLNRVLDGSRPLMIDLDGNARRIHRVIVYGKPMYPYYNAGYRIAQPSFSVSAL